MKSDEMVRTETLKQRDKYGLLHDIQQHDSVGLVEIAGIIAAKEEPPSCLYCKDQWFVKLWKKHKDDPVRRYAIAAAMLHGAIDYHFFETGGGR